MVHTHCQTTFSSFIQILSQIADEEIRIYGFPDCDSDEDEDYKKQVRGRVMVVINVFSVK